MKGRFIPVTAAAAFMTVMKNRSHTLIFNYCNNTELPSLMYQCGREKQSFTSPFKLIFAFSPNNHYCWVSIVIQFTHLFLVSMLGLNDTQTVSPWTASCLLSPLRPPQYANARGCQWHCAEMGFIQPINAGKYRSIPKSTAADWRHWAPYHDLWLGRAHNDGKDFSTLACHASEHIHLVISLSTMQSFI